MTVLAIDTATKVCSTALIQNDTLLAELSEVAPQQHAELLLPFVEKVMNQAGKEVSMLDRIAVSIGPGSFTGLRIGLSVAKGIAVGAKIPVIPVPTMEAIAYNVFRLTADNIIVSVILPARRHEYYYSRYRRSDEEPGTVSAISVVQTDELEAQLADNTDDVIAGEGIERLLEEIKSRTSQTGQVIERINIALDKKLNVSTASVTGLVSKYYDAVDASLVEPLYSKQFESGSARFKQKPE